MLFHVSWFSRSDSRHERTKTRESKNQDNSLLERDIRTIDVLIRGFVLSLCDRKCPSVSQDREAVKLVEEPVFECEARVKFYVTFGL